MILQEASDHVPHISDQFVAYTDNTDLAILLDKDTFEPDPMVFAFKEDSTSKGTWVWYYSSFEHCCDALHFLAHRRSHFAQYTSTMSWPRSVTHPLISYDGYIGYMKQHNVAFIGGDFNMSAFSTTGDVFSDTEFSAPGNSFLWGLGALEEPNRALGSS